MGDAQCVAAIGSALGHSAGAEVGAFCVNSTLIVSGRVRDVGCIAYPAVLEETQSTTVADMLRTVGILVGLFCVLILLVSKLRHVRIQ